MMHRRSRSLPRYPPYRFGSGDGQIMEIRPLHVDNLPPSHQSWTDPTDAPVRAKIAETLDHRMERLETKLAKEIEEIRNEREELSKEREALKEERKNIRAERRLLRKEREEWNRARRDGTHGVESGPSPLPLPGMNILLTELWPQLERGMHGLAWDVADEKWDTNMMVAQDTWAKTHE
ncbi:MAG: hypothetical protein M1817_004521 [Caeruleum heppii]|nr:MAG: hypothetical protein M1817_004521 [Caeruleum heppii]